MMSWMGSSYRDPDYEEKNRVSSYRGYLLKLRRSHNLLSPQWGKRWFSIEGRYLRWYRQDSDINASGFIDLRYVRSITKVELNGALTFCVNCEERNLIVRASSLTEMNGWIRALHMQADIARGGTGMTIVSDFNQLPMSQPKFIARKTDRTRTSLTLEQQLDLNLKKLNELELELSVPTEDNNFDAKSAEEDSELHNHHQGYNSKSTNNRSGYQNLNPLAEAPSAQFKRQSQQQQQQQQQQQHQQLSRPHRSAHTLSTSSAVSHSDSNDSIDQSPKTGSRGLSTTLTSASGVEATTMGGPYAQDVEELEQSLDSEFDQPTVPVRKVVVGKFMPTSASIYTNPKSASSFISNQQHHHHHQRDNKDDDVDDKQIHYQSKPRTPSKESVDSAEDSPSTSRVYPYSSTNSNSGSYSNSSHSKSKANLRGTKTAWV